MTSFLKFRVLTSHITLIVSYLSLLERQNFPAPLKIEQTLCHRQGIVVAQFFLP